MEHKPSFDGLTINNGKWAVLPIWLWYLGSVYILSQLGIGDMGKMNKHSPIYYTEGYWENLINRRNTLDRM